MADQDYISEEIEIGSGTTGAPETSSLGPSVVRPNVVLPTGNTALPEAVEIGQYRAQTPSTVASPTIGATIAAPSAFGVAPKQSAKVVTSSSSPTAEEIALVAAEVNRKCRTVSELSDLTGLSRDTILACLDLLMSDDIDSVVADDDLYCGLVTLNRLQKQLRGCRACIGEP